MAAEEHVKGLIAKKIRETDGYGKDQDKTTKAGVTWYKEESYQKINQKIEAMLSTASKSFKGTPGTPDYMIDTPTFRIVIETKGIEKNNGHKHSRFDDVSKYIKPNASSDSEVYDIATIQERKCAIDEALFYATFLNKDKDVIAIAASGTEKDKDFRLTSFFLPMKENLSKLVLIEDGPFEGTFNTVNGYKREIYKAKGYEEKLYREVYEDLRKYADAAAKFLNTNGVEENDRLGLVSAIVLALTNKKSSLYDKVSTNNNLEITPEEVKLALTSETIPYGVIIEDKLPPIKRNVLKTYFESLLNKPLLMNRIKIKDGKEVNVKDYFEINNETTKTVLSRITYSLYEFIVKTYENYQTSSVDVMGSFYSLFLQYAKADVKKGVVLTPKHITELFCDLAEYYSGEPLTNKTKVLDIATGSGGFLIAALNRMDKNIDADKSLNQAQKEKAKKEARENCLLGIENKDTMYVLAYANMRFHKDGKSSLYHGSSLCDDKADMGEGKTFIETLALEYTGKDKQLSDEEKVKVCGPDIGMMNPPYEEDVYEFIESMLTYLRKDAIGITIVPISVQSTNPETTAKKNRILNNHTLLASILMPADLFNGPRGSGAATSTCILVFKAHRPHKTFVENGGLTYLADWSNDGYKMFPKHGRFEEKNAWNNEVDGYKTLYFKDIKKIKAEEEFILSSDYKKDIHKAGSKKSIRKSIHLFDHVERTLKVNKKGEPVYKKEKLPKLDKDGNQKYKKNGQPMFELKIVCDENDVPIQDYDETEIYLNEDWNILDYIKTDYAELTSEDFIKTLLDYNLFIYMKENNILFTSEEQPDE